MQFNAVIDVIRGFQVSLLSGVTPNSLASLESSSFEPFIDKESKNFLKTFFFEIV